MFFIPGVILAQRGMLNTCINSCNEYESRDLCIIWKVCTIWKPSGGVLLMHLKKHVCHVEQNHGKCNIYFTASACYVKTTL